MQQKKERNGQAKVFYPAIIKVNYMTGDAKAKQNQGMNESTFLYL